MRFQKVVPVTRVAMVALATTLLLSAATIAASATIASAADEQPDVEPDSSDADDIVITEKARMHFKAGVNLLLDPDGAQYEEAYQQFKAAYQESPSWKIQGNLGVAAMQLERYGEAIEAFDDYLEKGKGQLPKEEAEQFKRDLETLRASVAYVKVSAPPGTSLTDLRSSNRGEDVKNYYSVPESGEIMIGIRPGEHRISAELEGVDQGNWRVSVKSQSTMEHTFGLEKAESSAPSETVDSGDSGTSRVPAYVALGVGAVGTGVGVAFLIVRAGQKNNAQEQYDGCIESGDCGQSERAAIEENDKKAASAGTISLISFGVGAAGLGTGIALLLFGNNEGQAPLEAEVGRMKFSPYASATQLGFSGTF